jgi:SAM-dependent methyltransferase
MPPDRRKIRDDDAAYSPARSHRRDPPALTGARSPLLDWRTAARRHVPRLLRTRATRFVQRRRLRRDFERLENQSTGRMALPWEERWGFFADATMTTGFDRHYVYHLAWAARILALERPERHVDVGSSLHFPSIVSAFLPIEFYDYRPAELQLDQLSAQRGDLLDLPFADRSLSSLSCMHTVEHVGLGRYGDPIDYDGDLKAMNELQRVLAPGGSLLFVVPVGRPRIVFNAHRIYSYEQIADAFANLELAEFALIPERGPTGLVRHADPLTVKGEEYACGCFHLRR